MTTNTSCGNRCKAAGLLSLMLIGALGTGSPAWGQSKTIPGTVTAGAARATGAPEGPAIGSVAADFSLPDVQGHLVRLSDVRGGQTGSSPGTAAAAAVTMLNFWAFWCDTWSAEMPSLRELAEERRNLNFRMAAVSVDGARLPEFARGTQGAPAPFPVLLDAGGRVSAMYRIHHVPTVVLLDRRGRVRYCAYGYPGNEVILNEMRKIINESTRHPA